MKFIFIRHGDTGWTMDDLYLGPLDLSLNLIGQEQATDLCPILSAMIPPGSDIILLSSPLKRAKETAEIVGDCVHASYKIIDELHERYLGDSRIDYIDAESEEVFLERAEKALDIIKNSTENESDQVIVVSHGIIFEQFAIFLEGEPRHIEKCGVHSFEIDI